MYFTGDGAHRDDDGDYTITGRMDDVINISGHRLGTAEIEDCLVSQKPINMRTLNHPNYSSGLLNWTII